MDWVKERWVEAKVMVYGAKRRRDINRSSVEKAGMVVLAILLIPAFFFCMARASTSWAAAIAINIIKWAWGKIAEKVTTPDKKPDA